MKKILVLSIATIISINCNSQISYENGYFINNSGQKINCLIKNIDWVNNPIDFEYKLSESGEKKRTNIKIVKEFGIYNYSKYIRKTVNIDRSREDIKDISHNRNPIFKKEELFLQVLIEGKANLYFYSEGSLKRYFYNVENSNVEQLVFKSFIVTDDKVEREKIGENNLFRQQLWNDLKCPTITMKKIENLRYTKNSLVNIFEEYNKSNDLVAANYSEKINSDLFNLTVRPRLNKSSLTIQNSSSSFPPIDCGSTISFGIGIEGEYILPFNKNKWSISIEPTYQYFKSENINNVDNVGGGKLITKLDYKSIEIPISFKHYFFLNDNSKILANVSYIFDLNSKSSIELIRANNSVYNSLEISTRDNLAFGIGFKFYDKYGLEMRYQTSRELLGDYTFWSSDYQTFSIIFGYSVF